MDQEEKASGTPDLKGCDQKRTTSKYKRYFKRMEQERKLFARFSHSNIYYLYHVFVHRFLSHLKETSDDDIDLKDKASGTPDLKGFEQNRTIFWAKIIEQSQKCADILDIIYNLPSSLIIRRVFDSNKDFLHFIISQIRELHPTIFFSNQLFSFEYKKLLKLPDNYYPLTNIGDGNCLYSAISCFYSPDTSSPSSFQKYFFIFKLCSLFILLEFENIFSKVLEKNNYDFDFDSFLLRTSKRDAWGCEINILALSLLTKRKIISYNPSLKHLTNNRLIFSFNEAENVDPLMIGFSHNHFFPILQEQHQSTNEIIINKDFSFYKI